MLPVVIIACYWLCLHDVTKQGCELHTVTQNKLCTVLVRSLHHFGAALSCQPLLLLTSEVMESCKLAARWRWWDAGKRLLYAPRLLCCERSEAWKAERSGCKRERAGSTSMEASSSCSCSCSCSCPNVRVKRGVTRCWRTLHPTVDCRLQGLAGCKLWTGERNRTLLRGLCLHPTAPCRLLFRPLPCSSC